MNQLTKPEFIQMLAAAIAMWHEMKSKPTWASVDAHSVAELCVLKTKLYVIQPSSVDLAVVLVDAIEHIASMTFGKVSDATNQIQYLCMQYWIEESYRRYCEMYAD